MHFMCGCVGCVVVCKTIGQIFKKILPKSLGLLLESNFYFCRSDQEIRTNLRGGVVRSLSKVIQLFG